MRGFAFVVLILDILLPNAINGSCILKNEKRILCCFGKNQSCSGFDNAGLPSSGRQIKCYCDEHCKRTNDCCSDYGKWCGKMDVNCLMSNWAQWSTCSESCGPGVQKRNRKIIIHPTYNGKGCEHTQQARVCRKKSCVVPKGMVVVKHRRHNKSRKDSAKYQSVVHIIPELKGNLNSSKLFNKQIESRSQIPIKPILKNNLTEPVDPVYCAAYRVTYSAPACKAWQRLSMHEQNHWRVSSQFLSKGQVLCLTCFDHVDHGYKCYGGKSLNKIHKWIAIRSDSCYGFFKMVDKPNLCQCHAGPLSYKIVR